MFKFLLAIALLASSIALSQDSTNNIRIEDTSAIKNAADNTQHF